MDGPDLAPAKPKRSRTRADTSASAPVVPAVPVASTSPELAARVAAIESAVRAVDVRVDTLSRALDTGLQEIASRSLVIAEATDDKVDDLSRRVGEVALALVKLQATVDSLDPSDIQSELRLVSDRLSTLLGGPSLTELMDRIDQLAGAPAAEEPKRRRKRGEPL